MRTSPTHPLQIVSAEPRSGFGRVGITFCPSKKQQSAMTGGWNRDLGLDLDVVSAFGASVLVTLIEQQEIEELAVQGIGKETCRRSMDWLHIPIRDVSVPGQGFEAAWQLYGPGLRGRLRDGFNIVVHCKGWLGRAGMIAARLLIELGADPEKVIAQVRHVRPGAIETAEQEAYVRSLKPVRESSPARWTRMRLLIELKALFSALLYLIFILVHAADIQDRDGAVDVLKAIRYRFPWLRHVFADGGYAAFN